MASREFRAAIVQRPAVLLDRAASTERVLAGIEEVVGAGASLAVFPEAYLPGYPDYIWRLSPGEDHELSQRIHGRLVEQAVDIGAGHLDPIADAARAHGLTIVLGIHERDTEYSRATLFNTVVTIGPDGSVLNRHRKLVPTNPERMVWSPGDGAGLRVMDTPLGRLGGLICWENYMPLARFALYAQGVEVYVAPNWDEGDGWVSSMRHIALEGRCWVLGAGYSTMAADIPADFPDRERLYPDPDEWINQGDSVIVAPDGTIAAGPLRGEHGILTADIDPALSGASHYTLDTAGHYNRPDVFQLRIDRSRRRQVSFDDGASHAGTASDVLEI